MTQWFNVIKPSGLGFGHPQHPGRSKGISCKHIRPEERPTRRSKAKDSVANSPRLQTHPEPWPPDGGSNGDPQGTVKPWSKPKACDFFEVTQGETWPQRNYTWKCGFIFIHFWSKQNTFSGTKWMVQCHRLVARLEHWGNEVLMDTVIIHGQDHRIEVRPRQAINGWPWEL